MDQVAALNMGVMTAGPSRPGKAGRKTAQKKTLIVTGVARSGTSLIAGMLRDAGVFMGEFIYDVVNEDAQVLEFLRSGDRSMLKRLIQARNAGYPSWGFKVPNLHAHLQHAELNLFRNPHLVVITRDPVAVAVRNSISEHTDAVLALTAAADAMQAMARFIQMARCPTLLLSYEKALAFPNIAIDSLLDFCEVQVSDFVRNQLFAQVQPNRLEYLAVATRHFVGKIEGILNGQLYGWCAQAGRVEPVRLELFADDELLETMRADRYREDLATGGLGNGCHGFFVDLSRYRLTAEAVIKVRIANRTLELDNSGQKLSTFGLQMSHA